MSTLERIKKKEIKKECKKNINNRGNAVTEGRAETEIGRFWTVAYIFLLCAVIGWIWEEAYCLIKHGFWVERGFLFGPWLPIYGLGGLFVYLLKERAVRKPVPLFLTSVGVAGVVEYFSSWVLELVYGKRWWDYTGKPLNINGRVHFVGLMFFGIAGCLVAYFVLPPYVKLLKKGNKTALTVIGAAVLSVFFTDVLLSLLFNFI